MPESFSASTEKPGTVARRSLLRGSAAGAGALAGLLGAGGIAAADQGNSKSGGGDAKGGPGFGGEVIPCHGKHQAGIATPHTANVRYLSFVLLPGVTAEALQRMFVVLTDDVEGLTSGRVPIADTEPELAERPARLTVTLGVGANLVRIVDPGKVPAWLGPVEAFKLDKFDGLHDGGDLLVVLQADDALAVAHAARMITRDIVSFAKPLWVQMGFRTSRGSEKPDKTMRNLMGQVDGTVNPRADELDELVWIDEGWLTGGSALVLRRIRMEIATWEEVDRPAREQSIGRTLEDGAPLSGGGEHTPADFAAKNEIGLPLIPTFSHIRRATSTDKSERILRRAVNYDTGSEAGLLFACYQRDPGKQFVPIQRRLDEMDLLNEWITHTGSAVFAVLPGFRKGELVGGQLFS